jgi:hypothetical protein
MYPVPIASLSSARRAGLFLLLAPAVTAAPQQIGCPPDTGGVHVWHVDASSNAFQPDGSSWESAIPHLADAIHLAAVCPGQDEIWVAAGTYYPDRSASFPQGNHDPDETFELHTGVAVYGGFLGLAHPFLPGGETAREQRDPTANETILSGDIGLNNQVPPPPDSYHVVTAGPGGNGRLDGFTIEKGDALDVGGGLYVDIASPTIARCTFRNNRAPKGAGVFVLTIGIPIAPRFLNCKFIGNHAEAGAGGGMGIEAGVVFPEDCEIAVADTLLVNCLFSGNTSTGVGAGMTVTNVSGCEHATARVFNCTFSENSAGGGAGAIDGVGSCSKHGDVLLHGSILWRNGLRQIDNVCLGLAATHSCIQGQALPGEGNITLDPLFCDANGTDDIAGTADDNPRLQDGSPCIDAGDDDLVFADVLDFDGDGDVTEPVPWDLDGGTRQFDALPGGARVDMGAYENQHLGGCAWDLDGDGFVGTADMNLLLASWGTCPGCAADFDCDGEVGDADLDQLQEHWGSCP